MDAAQRSIARYLREKMTAGDANDMANRICDGTCLNATHTEIRADKVIDQWHAGRMSSATVPAV
jgi:hypothetical protein